MYLHTNTKKTKNQQYDFFNQIYTPQQYGAMPLKKPKRSNLYPKKKKET